MTGREWLRALVVRQRNRPPATGGLVRADTVPVRLEGCTASPRQPAEPPPGTVMQAHDLGSLLLGQEEAELLRAERQRQRERADAYRATLAAHTPREPWLFDRPMWDVPPRCPCVGIYSRCHCPARA